MTINKQSFGALPFAALLAGWGAVYLPFILSLLLLAPERETLQPALLYGFMASIGMFALCVLPVIVYLHRKGQKAEAGAADKNIGAYIRFSALWVIILAILAGVAAAIIVAIPAIAGAVIQGGEQLIWWHSLLATTLVLFAVMIVPALLWSLPYWFLAVRPDLEDQGRPMRVVTGFSVLFVLWSLFCFLLAVNIAVPAGY